MNDQYEFFADLLYKLTLLRMYGVRKDGFGYLEYCMGMIRAAETLYALSRDDVRKLEDLMQNACSSWNYDYNFPSQNNAGPYMDSFQKWKRDLQEQNT